MPYADNEFLVLDDGRRFGPFSGHWPACAAMIRLSDHDFVSLGGDKPEDLALEPCPECHGLTYVIREYGETPCPECQRDAYIEHKQDIAAGF